MNKLKQKINYLAIGAVVALTSATDALARFGLEDEAIKPQGALSGGFKSTFTTVLNYFLGFLGLLALAFIVYAGVKMVISQGEEEEFNKARTMIIYAIVGLVVVILSWSIVGLITGIAG